MALILAFQEMLDEANALKARGNDLFREQDWPKALATYQEGINCLPHNFIPSPVRDDKGKGKDFELAENESAPALEPESKAVSPSVTGLVDQQCVNIRSILHANIAACHVKLVSTVTRWGQLP